jgi:predicted nucleotidyltransferase
MDLLMEFRLGTTLLDHAGLVLELETLLEVKMDVVSDNGLRESVREHVLREALAL